MNYEVLSSKASQFRVWGEDVGQMPINMHAIIH